MSLASIGIAAAVYAVLGVFCVGLVVVAALRRAGFVRVDDAPSAFLLPVAAGLIWSAVAFVAVALFQLSGIMPIVVKIALDVVLVVTLIAWKRPLADVPAILAHFDRFSGVLMILGGVIGIWAFAQFPHSFDSGQLLWTQKILLGERLPLEPMVGYSGLIGLPWVLFRDLPLVTFAAGFKPFLLVIAGFAAWQAVSNLSVPNPRVSTLIFFFAMLLSVFGTMGLVELGKDSIFGILFSVAFMTTLCRPDVEKHALDAALYFAAASLMGVIAVPYMLVAFGLWLLLAPTVKGALKVSLAMVGVNLPLLPLVVGSMMKKPLPLAYLGLGSAMVLGLTVFIVLARVSAAARLAEWGRAILLKIAPALPLAMFAICGALLPLRLDFASWFNADGSIVKANTFPLDGENDVMGVLLAYAAQNVIVALGLVVILIIGWTSLARERPAVVALAMTPLAALAVVLGHIALDLKFLSEFNEWDLTKDVPLWYGGALFGLFATAGLALVASSLGNAMTVRGRASATVNVLLGCALILATGYHGARRADWTRYTRAVERTGVGGSIDRDAARVFEASWKHLRGLMVYIDPGLAFVGPHFFNVQMFGAYPTLLNATTLNETVTCCGPVAFAVSDAVMPLVSGLAARHQASLTRIATFGPGDEAAVVLLTFDGKGRNDSPVDRRAGVAQLSAGAFGGETFRGRSFRWIGKEAVLGVTTAGEQDVCVALEAFSFGSDQENYTVTVRGARSSVAVPISTNERSSPGRPIVLRATNGQAQLTLTTNRPASRFPNDTRDIAYGLFQPISVLRAEDCPGAERVQ